MCAEKAAGTRIRDRAVVAAVMDAAISSHANDARQLAFRRTGYWNAFVAFMVCIYGLFAILSSAILISVILSFAIIIYAILLLLSDFILRFAAFAAPDARLNLCPKNQIIKLRDFAIATNVQAARRCF